MADDSAIPLPPGINPDPQEAERRAADMLSALNLQAKDDGGAAAANGSGGAAADGEGETYDDPDLALKTQQLRDDGDNIEVRGAGEGIYSSAATFEELGLSPELLSGLYNEMKFERPSKIQAKTLPMILSPPYKPLIAQAHNGSGKTTCFVLAMLSRVNPSVQAPQALCVCPTRELVSQNMSVLKKMGTHTRITATSTADRGQISKHERITEQVVVGTHGTLKNWIGRRNMAIDAINILVFDEADEMLRKEAFGDDSVRMIKDIKRASPNVQILLFSATFNERVKSFAQRVVPGANEVFIKKEELSLDVIKQYKVVCPTREKKVELVRDGIFGAANSFSQAIIFVATRETAKWLHSELRKSGFLCTSIQGDMTFEDRDLVVKEFRDGTTRVLIATDVLARGFDVSQVNLVVNYDLPLERETREPAFETYLHRIGRSGRFGRKGAAFNLISGPRDQAVIEAIERHFNHKIQPVELGDDETLEAVLVQAGLMKA